MYSSGGQESAHQGALTGWNESSRSITSPIRAAINRIQNTCSDANSPGLQARMFEDLQLQQKTYFCAFVCTELKTKHPPGNSGHSISIQKMMYYQHLCKEWSSFYLFIYFWLTCIVTILGNGWRVLAPPSMAMPKVLALFITLTSVEVGSSSPGWIQAGQRGARIICHLCSYSCTLVYLNTFKMYHNPHWSKGIFNSNENFWQNTFRHLC